MARNIQIECVKRTNLEDAHERISHVGGKNVDGSLWSLPQTEAVMRVESGEWNYYVSAGGKTVWVVIDVSEAGYRYLKTQADSIQPLNLLNLPDCPS